MTNKELQQLLSKYPDDAKITKMDIILNTISLEEYQIQINFNQNK